MDAEARELLEGALLRIALSDAALAKRLEEEFNRIFATHMPAFHRFGIWNPNWKCRITTGDADGG